MSELLPEGGSEGYGARSGEALKPVYFHQIHVLAKIDFISLI